MRRRFICYGVIGITGDTEGMWAFFYGYMHFDRQPPVFS